MSTEINLAIKRKKTSTFLSGKKVKKLRLFGLIFLFAVGALSAVLFVIIASSPLPSLRDQEKEASDTLTKLQPQFGKYLLIKSQLASVQTLLDTRPDLVPLIDTFNSLIPEGVSVSAVGITEKTLGFAISSRSLASVDSFFEAIEQQVALKKLPSTITTSPIAYNPNTGEYNFSVDFR